MKIVKQSVDVLSNTPEALTLIERAGRTCYKSEDKMTAGSANEFVRMIIRRGHESVLEHASMTCRIITDRGISHEIVRHRIGMSYSQESTRYVKYDGDMEVVAPLFAKTVCESIDNESIWARVEAGTNMKVTEEQEAWINACQYAEIKYRELIRKGVSPQWARSVLPNSLKTEIVVTGNFRAWRHFLRLRLASGAHPQIQEIAGMVRGWFVSNYPVIVEDI